MIPSARGLRRTVFAHRVEVRKPRCQPGLWRISEAGQPVGSPGVICKSAAYKTVSRGVDGLGLPVACSHVGSAFHGHSVSAFRTFDDQREVRQVRVQANRGADCSDLGLDINAGSGALKDGDGYSRSSGSSGSSSSSSSSTACSPSSRAYLVVQSHLLSGGLHATSMLHSFQAEQRHAHSQARHASSKRSMTVVAGSDLQHYRQRLLKLARRISLRVWDFSRRLAKTSKSLTIAFIRDPRIVKEWYEDIRDAVVHFCRWVATGFRLFGADVRASFYLMKRVVRGYPMTLRQRNLLVRTTSDCLKLIPFSFFIIVPFAELALPFFLRLFPGMLPSTFFEQKYDNATLARKLKAKEEMAEFWQRVVLERTKEISEADSEFADKATELQRFQEKLMEGKEYPRLKEILIFSKLFETELALRNMTPSQLKAMSQMLGLPQSNSWWPGHLEVTLRHHITNLRREDRDYLWEGIDGLTEEELIEACRKRAIRFHEVTEAEMRKDLTRWLELSANRSIPTSLLLWIQTFYLRAREAGDADCSELQMRMDEPPEPQEPEAKEAFHGMAERQKASLLKAQQKLEVLQNEIDEVIEQPEAEAGAAGEALAAEAPGAELEEHLEERRRVLQRAAELDASLRLYREVVARQRELLEHQLGCLRSMRNNEPTQHKDVDVVLLDQRVRLMEMIGAFERSIGEIEQLLAEDGPPAGGKSEEGAAWAWPPPDRQPAAPGPT